jgi:transglutaminase-like putative cysteine protease
VRRRDACLSLGLLWRRAGWIGLDPTNAILASDAHIVLAFARDYSSVTRSTA